MNASENNKENLSSGMSTFCYFAPVIGIIYGLYFVLKGLLLKNNEKKIGMQAFAFSIASFATAYFMYLYSNRILTALDFTGIWANIATLILFLTPYDFLKRVMLPNNSIQLLNDPDSKIDTISTDDKISEPLGNVFEEEEKEEVKKEEVKKKKVYPLGEMLTTYVSKSIKEKHIQEALNKQKNDPTRPLLGTILYRNKIASKHEIETALSYQLKKGKDAKLAE